MDKPHRKLRVVNLDTAAGRRAVRKSRKPTKPEPDDGLPTTWKSYDRNTGGYKHLKIAEMGDAHLLAAIAYCERKAVDYQHMTNLPPKDTAARLWPGYVALVKEAARRFGPSQVRPDQPPDRAIILPDE